MEERISHLMEVLNISREEALQVIQDDISIDKGADLFPLTKEQKEAEKKARGTGTRTVYNFNKRERKADDDKATLINTLFTAILPLCETYEIQNSEREFTFTYKSKKYKVVLSVPRK